MTTLPAARSGRRSARHLSQAAAWAAMEWAKDHRPGRVRSACYAPHSAMYFQPDGVVRACCATVHAIGHTTGPERRTLHEIWVGAELQQQRDQLEAGSFDLGCQECEFALNGGGRPASFASHFDRWRHGAPHSYPKLLDLALSNRCNLACIMCNGDLSSTIRVKREGRAPLKPAYDDQFFAELADLLPHAERVQFKGGEPFLAPENWRVWDLMLDLGVECETFIVTNGTVWNERVEKYLRLLRPELTVSVDGTTAEVLDPIRIGAHAEELWKNIDRFQAITEQNGRPFTLNYCLLTKNWHDLPAFLQEVDRRGIRCYVMPITEPQDLDLMRRPADELQRVLEVLEACAPSLTSPNPQRQLAQICARLRSQIASPATLEVSVDLTRRPAKAAAEPSR